MKTILDLNSTEARKFFLKKESYCSIQLPEYFDFQTLLDALAQNGSLKGGLSLEKAKKCDEVNYKLLTNKDGKFAWRSLQLINPAIYVFLVNKITDEKNWHDIKNRFHKLQKNKQINCCSIPPISTNEKESDKAKTIQNWWYQIEQQSIELALKYDCFLNTDITEYYNSIYTHTIPWALHGKQKVKQDFLAGVKRKEIGDIIDTTIQSMQYSQTNGIPQGSVLMDFIAEIILGYADAVLSCKIEIYNRNKKIHRIEDYQIIRYRDDYRIFATNQETVVKIAKLLTETLIDLNLKLNTQKTFISDKIIRDTIKPDKIYWNDAKQSEKTLQKHLFLIHTLAEKHPNSGSLSKALDKFLDRVFPLKLFKEENPKILISILLDIAYSNPRTYPVITAILSKILSLEVDKENTKEIFEYIDRKFSKIPNVGHLEVWLQRLTIKINPEKEYAEQLCKKVADDTAKIWNIDWLNENIITVFRQNSIIDRQKINELPQIIEPKEIKIFNDNY